MAIADGMVTSSLTGDPTERTRRKDTRTRSPKPTTRREFHSTWVGENDIVG